MGSPEAGLKKPRTASSPKLSKSRAYLPSRYVQDPRPEKSGFHDILNCNNCMIQPSSARPGRNPRSPPRRFLPRSNSRLPLTQKLSKQRNKRISNSKLVPSRGTCLLMQGGERPAKLQRDLLEPQAGGPQRTPEDHQDPRERQDHYEGVREAPQIRSR